MYSKEFGIEKRFVYEIEKESPLSIIIENKEYELYKEAKKDSFILKKKEIIKK